MNKTIPRMLYTAGFAVEVTYRRMKSIRLRIKPDGRILLSVPYFTSEQYIQDFLISKEKWIERTSKRFAATAENRSGLLPDSAAAIAGFSSSKPEIGETDTAFEKRWRNAALADYKDAVNRLYPVVRNHSKLVPVIKLRKMKSLWGSCNRKTGVITLNTILFRAPQRCIDYVVLHELAHYLYRNHDDRFYGFIAGYMSDWKERQRYLNQTICLS